MDGFNSELEDVEENSVKLTWPFSHIHVLQGIQASCLSDVSLAFAVQDVPSEALVFSNKAEAVCKCRSKLNLTPWRPFRFSENVAGRLGDPRGNSLWFPFGLVWAKRHDVSGRRPYLKQGLGQRRVSRWPSE
jgi:hypothetical protein